MESDQTGMRLSALGAGLGFIAGLIFGILLGLLYLAAFGPLDVECDLQEVGTSLACIPLGIAALGVPVLLGAVGGAVLGPPVGSWIALAGARKGGAGATALIAVAISVAGLFLGTWLLINLNDGLEGVPSVVRVPVLLVTFATTNVFGPVLLARLLWQRAHRA